jgi:hypothetical protein
MLDIYFPSLGGLIREDTKVVIGYYPEQCERYEGKGPTHLLSDHRCAEPEIHGHKDLLYLHGDT